MKPTMKLNMKPTIKFKKLAAIALIACGQSAYAAFSLPAFNTSYAGIDGDFETYSLPLMQFILESDGNLNSGDAFYIKSTPGELGIDGKYVVIGTFPKAAQDNGDVSASMDDAFELVNGGAANTTAFSTFNSGPVDVDLDGIDDGLTDPSPSFAGDRQDSWDANLGDLVAFTGSTDIVAFFNFNEANSDDAIFGTQFLQTWVHAWITLASDEISLGDFYLRGTDSDNTAENPLGPNPSDFNGNGDPLDTVDILDSRNDWANAFGQVCLDPQLNVASNPGCGSLVPDTDNDDLVFNHNLGADNAAYVVTSRGLNALVASLEGSGLANYVLHIDWRARFADNGFEQAFLLSTEGPNNVPEPGTLGLVGVGLWLASSRWVRRRRLAGKIT